ncbi:MAG: HDOD domain-containing protein [FCB group bacterium]|nr:HDOD domain-containing protein [FCB group bacterium]
MLFGPPKIDKYVRTGNVKKLIKALKYDKDHAIQEEAIDALGILRDPRGVIPLAELLRDGSEHIKVLTAKALGELGHPAAVPELLANLGIGSVGLRPIAARALGLIGDKSAVKGLEAAFNLKSEELQEASAKALGLIGDRSAIGFLIKNIEKRSDNVKCEVVMALERIGDENCAGALVDIYQKGSGEVRAAASKALARFGFVPDKEKADNWVKGAEQKREYAIPDKLLELIRGKGDLPSIPEIINRLHKKLNDPESTLPEIANLIKTEPALTARVIQIANSSFYSPGGVTITNLVTALGRLGIEQVRDIVYSISVLKQFESAKLIDNRKFWAHSLVTAFLSQSLCRVSQRSKIERESAFVAGLMHDVGIMVFCHIVPGAYERFLKMMVGDRGKFSEFHLDREEKESMGTSHQEVGAAYIEHWWPVDEDVVNAVGDHHKDITKENLPFISKVVLIANEYARSAGIDNGINVQVDPQPFDKNLLKVLDMSDEQIEKFLLTIKIDIEAAQMFMTLG